MDPEDVRALMKRAGVDLWALIEGAVALAAKENPAELRLKRDGVVELLYCGGAKDCRNSKVEQNNREVLRSPATPQFTGGDEEEEEVEESQQQQQPKVVEIEGEGEEDDDDDRQNQNHHRKNSNEFIIDPYQSEESLVKLLQKLDNVVVTFKDLQKMQVGRSVSNLRKHPSPEVSRWAKKLVRKWKVLVDDWVKTNEGNDSSVSPSLIAENVSPQQIPRENKQDEHHQDMEFVESPNPHKPEKHDEERKPTPKSAAVQQTQSPLKKPNPTTSSTNTASINPAKHMEESEEQLEEKLASSVKRLHNNYQKHQNDKKQKTIQVMELHEIPKPKNGFVARNKGIMKHR